MKAIFRENGKEVINNDIGDIFISIELNKKDWDSKKYDEDEYAEQKISENDLLSKLYKYEIEAPLDNLVTIRFECFEGEGFYGSYPENEDELKALKITYNELIKLFPNSKVKVTVDIDDFWDDYNEDDYSIEEFLNRFILVNN